MNELLDCYRVERNEDITYAAFQSPFELLTEIEKGIRPDILFLDVVMPGQNGMDVAKEIRQYDTNMKIIFLTSSPEFAVESYSVGAYFYQLKPIWEESFFRLMDAVQQFFPSPPILPCEYGVYPEYFQPFHQNGK